MFKKRAEVVNKEPGPSDPFLIWASGFAYHLANSTTKDIRGALWCFKSERTEDHIEPRWTTSPPDYVTGMPKGFEDEEDDFRTERRMYSTGLKKSCLY